MSANGVCSAVHCGTRGSQVTRQAGSASENSGKSSKLTTPRHQTKWRQAAEARTNSAAANQATSITAALFIKEFTGDLPWVHVDIAGTAWAEEAKPYQPKGATGVGVRTLVELARDVASWHVLDERC